jgi:hypothetical protein
MSTPRRGRGEQSRDGCIRGRQLDEQLVQSGGVTAQNRQPGLAFWLRQPWRAVSSVKDRGRFPPLEPNAVLRGKCTQRRNTQVDDAVDVGIQGLQHQPEALAVKRVGEASLQ